MAGVVWKQCVVLLAFLAWQACSAQKLVNLVEPQLTKVAPRYIQRKTRPDTDTWVLFDHDTTTYADFNWVGFQFSFVYPINPTIVRIHMAAHAQPKDYPRQWLMRFNDKRGPAFQVQVKGAKFTNGMFETKLPDIPVNGLKMRFVRLRRTYSIAEIELLGPRKALDKLWPFGKYPCEQRLAVITDKKGPTGELFYAAKNSVKPKELRTLFSPDEEVGSGLITFDFDGGKPVIIGVELPKSPLVREVAIDAFQLASRYRVEQIVLEGHFCKPNCNKLGSKGWVRLSAAKTFDVWTPQDHEAPRLFVDNPDTYKAYRLKFVPMTRPSGKSQRTNMSLWGIYFLGCKAGGA